jgi:thiol-disulfide isomerase/thioredoxin
MRVRVAVLLLVISVAGCGGEGGPEGAEQTVSSPLADCTGLTEPLAPAETRAGGEPLPDLTLPCFTGGEPFRLADLRGPAVVNLWASWCPPCREELPALQRYADRTAGEVHVLGVVTQEARRGAPATLAQDFGLTFPALDDRDGLLMVEVAGSNLPATIFVDAAGSMRYVHRGPLDEEALDELAAEHLGVAP